MDDLTNHILVLLGKGKITKEAAVQALSLNRKGVIKLSSGIDGSTAVKGMTTADAVKLVGLNLLMNKGLELGSGALDYATSGLKDRSNDAVFQKLMREHPSMQGKDPARAKANFDYIASTSPHLLKHPLILGDNVANMTAMGVTSLPTLNELSELQKHINTNSPKSQFPSMAAKTISEAYMNEVVNPSQSPDQMMNANIIKMRDEQLAKFMAHRAAKDAVHNDVDAQGKPKWEALRDVDHFAYGREDRGHNVP